MRLKRVLVTVLGAAGAAASVAGATGCGASATVDPVAQAADATQSLPGAHLRLTETISTAQLPQPITIAGTGFLNQKLRSGEMSFDFSSLPGADKLPGGKNMRIEFAWPVMYMNFPALSSQLPGHKPWVKIDLQKAGQAAGINLSSLSQTGGSDPSQYLDELRASGDTRKVGSETVNGVATTHYKGVIHLDRVVDRVPAAQQAAARASVAQLEKMTGLTAMPVDVWIDSERRVRREQMTFQQHLPTGASVSAHQTIDFLSFGPTPAVTPPPADQVMDLTGQAAAGLTKASGG